MCRYINCLLAIILCFACESRDDSTLHSAQDNAQVAERAPRPTISADEASKGDVIIGEEPELTFSGDFTERLTAEVRAADILTIHYDLKRMSECERGVGRYLQYLTGFYQVDDQQVESFDYIPSYTRASQAP